ncbi:MAG: hypothetical protein P8Y71_06630 [Pseudolabrys sp.]
MHCKPALLAALIAAGALLASCQTDSTGQPAARAAPLTHQQAALDCWMATEHGRADLPLDKRTAIVDACIKDKMQGKPPPAAVMGKPKQKSPRRSKAKADTKPKT